MPAQKRAQEVPEDDGPSQYEQDSLNEHAEDAEEAEESDRSVSSSNEEKDEFVTVKLSEIRKEVQCPICLGIIRKTRTVMECLHRFCRECIDKSMRLGNNECPACRTHCASRRSLRDDPNYDALIAALYPDIDKYEEEELAFQEEEKACNKQIQATIAQTFRRQSESAGRKRTTFVRRLQGNYRNTHLRGKRNYRNAAELLESDDNEDANGNDGAKDSSSDDERRPRKLPRRKGSARFSQPSSKVANNNSYVGDDENESEVNRETIGSSIVGLVGSSERLAWGKGGIRSSTRYGSMSGGNGKNSRNNRFSKLVDYLQHIEDNDEELNINLILVSHDEQRIPALPRSYLCCRPTLSVQHLYQYIALQTAVQVDEVEISLVKELRAELNTSTLGNLSFLDGRVLDPCKDELQLLNEQDTLAELIKAQSLHHGYLILTYRKKLNDSKMI